MSNHRTSKPMMMELGWKILPWLADVVCGLLVYWATQINAEVRDLRIEVQTLKEWKAETSGNRYTAKDHVEYADKNSEEMNRVWQRIAEMQSTWLANIGDVKVSMARIESQLDQHMKNQAAKQQ